MFPQRIVSINPSNQIELFPRGVKKFRKRTRNQSIDFSEGLNFSKTNLDFTGKLWFGMVIFEETQKVSKNARKIENLTFPTVLTFV